MPDEPVPTESSANDRCRTSASKPLLRWAGSKKRQYKSLRRIFPREVQRYVEPFAGSASFLFKLAIPDSVVNDINSDVIDFYKQVRANPDPFFEFLDGEPRSRDRYLQIRSRFNGLEAGIERSILFYYLNRNCFNGIYRVNKSGHFNVPFADCRVAPYLTAAEFSASINALNAVELYNDDFEPFVRSKVRKGDFVFLDPPYYDSEVRIFSEYNVKPFRNNDLTRLGSVLEQINSSGASFLLVYPCSREILPIAERWKSIKTQVLRTIASNPINRRSADELLITNYDR